MPLEQLGAKEGGIHRDLFAGQTLFHCDEQLAPFRAIFLRYPQFPLDEERTIWLQELLKRFFTLAAIEVETITMLEVNHLPIRNSANTLSSHARQWLPMTGLGVFPEDEPPRLWRESDFLDRNYGEPLRNLMNTIMRVEAGEAAARQAAHAMIGSGALSLLAISGLASDVVEELCKIHSAAITEEALLGMPFYLPLISLATLKESTGRQLAEWLGPCSLYIRESPEDGGILFLSPLVDLLTKMNLWSETADV